MRSPSTVPQMSYARPAGVLLMVLACSSCVSAVHGAEAQFTADTTCRRYAITATPLRVLTTAREPPRDVAADPTQLAAWRRTDDARQAHDQEKKLFLVEGCGESRVYGCHYCTEGRERTTCGVSPICAPDPACWLSQAGTATCDGQGSYKDVPPPPP